MSLSQIAESRGFCREYVRLIHPDFTPAEIESFWQHMNPLPAVRRKAQAKSRIRICDRCQGEYTAPACHGGAGNNRRYCDSCRDEIDAERDARYNARRRQDRIPAMVAASKAR
jgi:hypothetical protein